MRNIKTNKQKNRGDLCSQENELDYTVENACLDEEDFFKKITLEPRLECQEQVHLVFQAEGTARTKTLICEYVVFFVLFFNFPNTGRSRWLL